MSTCFCRQQKQTICLLYQHSFMPSTITWSSPCRYTVYNKYYHSKISILSLPQFITSLESNTFPLCSCISNLPPWRCWGIWRSVCYSFKFWYYLWSQLQIGTWSLLAMQATSCPPWAVCVIKLFTSYWTLQVLVIALFLKAVMKKKFSLMQVHVFLMSFIIAGW